MFNAYGQPPAPAHIEGLGRLEAAGLLDDAARHATAAVRLAERYGVNAVGVEQIVGFLRAEAAAILDGALNGPVRTDVQGLR